MPVFVVEVLVVFLFRKVAVHGVIVSILVFCSSPQEEEINSFFIMHFLDLPRIIF